VLSDTVTDRFQPLRSVLMLFSVIQTITCQTSLLLHELPVSSQCVENTFPYEIWIAGHEPFG